MFILSFYFFKPPEFVSFTHHQQNHGSDKFIFADFWGLRHQPKLLPELKHYSVKYKLSSNPGLLPSKTHKPLINFLFQYQNKQQQIPFSSIDFVSQFRQIDSPFSDFIISLSVMVSQLEATKSIMLILLELAHKHGG